MVMGSSGESWVFLVGEARPTGGGAADVSLATVDRDGGECPLAAWSAGGGEGEEGYLLLSLSPDRAAVAVLAGGELRTLLLGDGAVPSRLARAPEPEELLPDPQDLDLVWQPDGTAVAWWPVGEGSLAAALGHGWELSVEGAVILDEGHTGHHSSSPRLSFRLGTPEHVMEAEKARFRERSAVAARRPTAFRLRARFGASETLVHEEERTPAEGVTQLHWPPVVGPLGVLLRRSVKTTRHELRAGDPFGGEREDTEMQCPWLVSPEGEVRALPVELGVSPLTALPDGRFLLPGADALWRDGRDEPLHTLSDDGRMEPVLLGGEPVTPTRLLATLAPDGLPEKPPDIPEDARWGFDQARVDPHTGELVLLLADGPWEDSMSFERVRWLVVGIPLTGTGGPSLVARGEWPVGTLGAIAL